MFVTSKFLKFLNLKIQNCGCGWSWSRSDFFRSLMERTFTLSLAHYCRNRRSWKLGGLAMVVLFDRLGSGTRSEPGSPRSEPGSPLAKAPVLNLAITDFIQYYLIPRQFGEKF